jgi:hypothetical protein
MPRAPRRVLLVETEKLARKWVDLPTIQGVLPSRKGPILLAALSKRNGLATDGEPGQR